MSYVHNWNDPAYDSSPFVKWEKEGDEVEGVILDITSHTFPAKDGEPERTYPVLHLDTVNGAKELTISGVDLLDKTRRAAPQVGDNYYASWVATAGKKRVFTVKVKKAAEYEAMHPKAASTPVASNPNGSPAAELAYDGEPPF